MTNVLPFQRVSQCFEQIGLTPDGNRYGGWSRDDSQVAWHTLNTVTDAIPSLGSSDVIDCALIAKSVRPWRHVGSSCPGKEQKRVEKRSVA